MENKPGISWGTWEPDILKDGTPFGTSCRVNLMRSSKGWLAVYYDDDKSGGEIIKIFKNKKVVDYYKMLETLALWNYGICELCPVVKMELEYTA